MKWDVIGKGNELSHKYSARVLNAGVYLPVRYSSMGHVYAVCLAQCCHLVHGWIPGFIVWHLIQTGFPAI